MKEFIEIPFGAKDSELMEATYFIPQGYHAVIYGDKVIIKKGEEPISNDLEEAAEEYNKSMSWRWEAPNYPHKEAFIAGAEWADKTAWKPADGDNLPEIDREVIALVEEIGYYKVVYAHRPPEYWDGRNIITNEVTRNYTKRYDKGEWNQPNVKWWLDLELPKIEE